MQALVRNSLENSEPDADWDQIRNQLDEVMNQLDEVMDQLAEQDRTAILMRFFFHITASELANDGKRLAAEIADVRQRLTTRTHEEEDLGAALRQAQIQNGKLSSAPAVNAQPTSKPPRRDLSDLMEADPALRTLFKQSFRSNLGLQFQLLYDRAHLSSEQIERFEALMTDAEQDRLDLQAATKAQGLAANDPALSKMRQQTEEKLQSAQKEILGDAGYLLLQQYNRQKPLLALTTSVASPVAYTGTPLSAPQVDQLLEVLSNASSQYQTGGRADLTTIDSKRVLQNAERIFTPNQFVALQANSNMIELSKLREQFYQQKKADVK